jgi:hypothetical protein
MVKDCEKELQLLEHKKMRYQSEYERKKTKLQVDESDHKQMYQFQYEVQMKDPKMRRSVTRKRALLHDTLHSQLKLNHKVTAYETKEGEEYTIDLLRKTEEKDLEAQRKFLERLIQKEAEEKELAAQKRRLMRQRIASARPFNTNTGERRVRCLSAVMKKQEEDHMRTMKKPYIPPEMMVGLHTQSTNSKMWSQSHISGTNNKKWTFSNPMSLNSKNSL